MNKSFRSRENSPYGTHSNNDAFTYNANQRQDQNDRENNRYDNAWRRDSVDRRQNTANRSDRDGDFRALKGANENNDWARNHERSNDWSREHKGGRPEDLIKRKTDDGSGRSTSRPGAEDRGYDDRRGMSGGGYEYSGQSRDRDDSNRDGKRRTSSDRRSSQDRDYGRFGKGVGNKDHRDRRTSGERRAQNRHRDGSRTHESDNNYRYLPTFTYFHEDLY